MSQTPALTSVVFRTDSKLHPNLETFNATAGLTVYAPSTYENVKNMCTKFGIRYKKLDAPKWVSKTRTATTATLKWKAAPNAVEYKVYKKIGSGSYKLVKTTTSLSYKATGLKKGTTYRFAVSTVVKDADGRKIESPKGTVYKTLLN